MKILIFGDSNTTAYNYSTKDLYDEKQCWWGILKKILMEDGLKIELYVDALNSRALFGKPYRSHFECLDGSKQISKALSQHPNADYIIIALGSNDLMATKEKMDDVDEIYGRLKNFFVNFTENNLKHCILMTPSPHESIDFKIEEVLQIYKKFSNEYGMQLIDITNINPPCLDEGGDGMHFSISNHNSVAKKTYNILNPKLN